MTLFRRFANPWQKPAAFAKDWQIGGLALLVLFAAGVASAQQAPPALPFALPDGVQVQESLTSWEPEQFLHRAVLNRALTVFEQAELAERLAAQGWQMVEMALPGQQQRFAAAAQLAAGVGVSAPFEFFARFYADGARSWSLPPIQMLYLPLAQPVFVVTFPLDEAMPLEPLEPGMFAFQLPLPLLDARFIQRSLQREKGLLVAVERWEAQVTPYLMDLIENQLIAAGYFPMDVGIPQTDREGQQMPEQQLLRNMMRAFQRLDRQVSVLRLPADGDPAAASCIFISRQMFPTEFLE